MSSGKTLRGIRGARIQDSRFIRHPSYTIDEALTMYLGTCLEHLNEKNSQIPVTFSRLLAEDLPLFYRVSSKSSP